MTSHLNNNANMPWVWSVAQRLEQQPRKLKMWGSIPYHAHHFLICFAIGARTTIMHMIPRQNTSKIIGGYCCFSSWCAALVLSRAQETKTL